jgi:hypothetical protein
MELLARHQVDLVLSGHIHDPVTRLSTTRYPEFQRSLILSVAGTTTSWRTRRGAPNSFNIYEIGTKAHAAIEFTRYVLSKSGAFEPEERISFRRQDGHWEALAGI